MEVIEQLLSEASKQAGSSEGFLRLIQLILKEVEKLDVAHTYSDEQYITLLRAYIFVKRQLQRFLRRSENENIPKYTYDNVLRELKHAIVIKRAEAQKYAESLPCNRREELNRFAGVNPVSNRAIIL